MLNIIHFNDSSRKKLQADLIFSSNPNTIRIAYEQAPHSLQCILANTGQFQVDFGIFAKGVDNDVGGMDEHQKRVIICVWTYIVMVSDGVTSGTGNCHFRAKYPPIHAWSI